MPILFKCSASSSLVLSRNRSVINQTYLIPKSTSLGPGPGMCAKRLVNNQLLSGLWSKRQTFRNPRQQ